MTKKSSYHERNRDRLLPILRARALAYRKAANPECGVKTQIAIRARAEAKASGSKHYFTGIPCKHGHVAKRFLSNGQCVDCVLAWIERNPDKYDASRKAWGKNNPEKFRSIARNASHRRRARKNGSGGSYTQSEIDALLKKQKGRCANSICRMRLGNKFQIDHIHPLSKGGSNSILNIQLLCRPCNQGKSSKLPLRWAQENGLLL